MTTDEIRCIECGHILGEPGHRFIAVPADMVRKVVKASTQTQMMLIELKTRGQMLALATLALSLLTEDDADTAMLDAEDARNDKRATIEIE